MLYILIFSYVAIAAIVYGVVSHLDEGNDDEGFIITLSAMWILAIAFLPIVGIAIATKWILNKFHK